MGTVTMDAGRPSAGRDWGLIAAMTVSAHPVAFLFGLALVGFSGFLGSWGLLAPPIGWTLFGLVAVATDRQQLPGRAIRPDDEPELATLVRAVAERLGFQVPLLVRLVPVPEAGLIATKVSGVRVFVLALGWPLLRWLTAAQLAAVVAHELAHELHAADRRTSHLLAARGALVDSMENIVHVPSALAGRMLRATQQRSWQLETAADASSAEVAGSSAVRGALEQTGSITALFEMLGGHWASTLAEDKSYPQDLYDALDTARGDTHVVTLIAAESLAADAAEALDNYGISTHPPRATRMAAIPERPGGGWDASGPLRLRNADALDLWCVQELAGSEDPSEGLRPVRVLDCPPERFDVPVGEAYSALVEATGSDSVPDAMVAAVEAIADGGWVQLAGSIEPEIGHAPKAQRAGLRREVLVDCLGRAVEGCLLDAGWHRASRWITSVLASPDDEVVDVRALIERCIDSSDPTDLRSLLAQGDSRALA